MQGTSHTGFALAGSLCVGSTLNTLFPQRLPNDWEYLVHALGPSYTFQHLAQNMLSFWQHPILPAGDVMIIALQKLTFYLTVIICARLPDAWQRRADGGSHFSHRGFTHSFLMWLLLCFFFGLSYYFVLTYCRLYAIPINEIIVKEVCVIFLGLLSAFILHSIADLFSYQGVKVLWPAEDSYSPLPRALRYTNESWREYAFLWSVIFATGILFTLGIIGL